MRLELQSEVEKAILRHVNATRHTNSIELLSELEGVALSMELAQTFSNLQKVNAIYIRLFDDIYTTTWTPVEIERGWKEV